MDTKEKPEEVLTREIGYFARSSSRTVTDATMTVETWKITGVEYIESKVHIKTLRPGLIIGQHGKNLIALIEYLKKNPHGIIVDTVCIIEDKTMIAFYDNLYNFQYEEYMRGNF